MRGRGFIPNALRNCLLLLHSFLCQISLVLCMVDVASMLQVFTSALNRLTSPQLSCLSTFVFFATAFSSILADYVRYVVTEVVPHVLFKPSHSRLGRRRSILRASLKLSLHSRFFFLGIRAETGELLTFFQDLVDHLSFEVIHILVLQVLDCVAAHDFVAQFVLGLADHQTRILLVAVALVGNFVVALQFLSNRLVQILLLVVAELRQRPNCPCVVQMDLILHVVRNLLLHVDQRVVLAAQIMLLLLSGGDV